MSLERVLHHLCDAIDGLRNKLEEVAVHVGDDWPWDGQARNEAQGRPGFELRGSGSPHYLVQELDESVSDVLGWIASARSAAGDARSATESSASLDLARRALGRCRNSLDRVRQQFERHVGGPQTLARLEEAGREKQGEWPGWVECLTREMELGRRNLAAAERGLVDSLEELAAALCGADRSGGARDRAPSAALSLDESDHTRSRSVGVDNDTAHGGPSVGSPANGTVRSEHNFRSTAHGLRR